MSDENAQPGDRTTDPGIVMRERCESSQRVISLARAVNHSSLPDTHPATHSMLAQRRCNIEPILSIASLLADELLCEH